MTGIRSDCFIMYFRSLPLLKAIHYIASLSLKPVCSETSYHTTSFPFIPEALAIDHVGVFHSRPLHTVFVKWYAIGAQCSASHIAPMKGQRLKQSRRDWLSATETKDFCTAYLCQCQSVNGLEIRAESK